MKNNTMVRQEITLFDTVYRLKNYTVKEILDKYPDRVTGLKVENGKTVLFLDGIRLKYASN